jgi:16S rRNA G1207 methylase RsmC
MTTNKDEAQPLTHASYKQRQLAILHTVFSMGKRGAVDGKRHHTVNEAAQQLDALTLEAIGKPNDHYHVSHFVHEVGCIPELENMAQDRLRAELHHIITGKA